MCRRVKYRSSSDQSMSCWMGGDGSKGSSIMWSVFCGTGAKFIGSTCGCGVGIRGADILTGVLKLCFGGGLWTALLGSSWDLLPRDWVGVFMIESVYERVGEGAGVGVLGGGWGGLFLSLLSGGLRLLDEIFLALGRLCILLDSVCTSILL